MPWDDTFSRTDTDAAELRKNTTTHEEYENTGNNSNSVIETNVSVLSLNGDMPKTADVQGTNSLQDNTVSGINISQDNTVQGTNHLQDNNVSGINSSQEKTVSGINISNVTEDHNYAVNSTNSTGVTSINNSESTDVNGSSSLNSLDNAQLALNTITTDVEIEPTDSNQIIEPEECDSTTDGNSSTDTISKLHNLFLVKNPETALYKMWEKDANKKRLSVKIIKMNKDEIYRMSHPMPNWLAMDPNSSLEEMVSESEKETDNVPTQNSKYDESNSERQSYYMRERKVNRLTRSLCSVAMHNYKEDSDDNDSDYTPVTRTVRNVNLGLRNPSKECMNAQCQISENHEHLGLPATNVENVEQSSSESNEFQSDLKGKGNTGKLPMPKPVLLS